MVDDPGLIRAVHQLPRGVRVAGVSDQLDWVPALTGRAISAAPRVSTSMISAMMAMAIGPAARSPISVKSRGGPR